MRSLAREESEESPEESDLKKLTSVTAPDPKTPLPIEVEPSISAQRPMQPGLSDT